MLPKWRLDEILPNMKPRYVYGIRSGQFIKIGVATNIAARLNIMRLSNPHELTVVLRRKSVAAFHCEKKMHEVLKAKACGREWFNATLEEAQAAFIVGAAHAKQVYLQQTTKFTTDAPVTSALDDVAESVRKMGLT